MNERKYVDPKAGLTFKKIFGEQSDLITCLLNALRHCQTCTKPTSIKPPVYRARN